MFELIRANRRKSVVLIFLMLGLLLGVGFAIGFTVFPATESVVVGQYRYFFPVGGLIGMGIAFLLWGGQALAAYSAGDRLLMAAAGAREIKKQDHPRLFNIVEEMTLAARLPAMPKVYIIEDMSLNAFAAGRDPNHAAVAVTQGLLAKLNRDQLQGVIAHEIAHIANRDVQFMTFAGIMLGSIIMLTEIFLRMMWYSNMGGSRRYSSRGSSGKNEGAARAIMLVVALVLSIVAPLLAQLLYFASSRQREYLADAGGAVFTRYPEGLASALEVISGNPGAKESVSKALAPMYIINPLQSGTRSLSSLTSTHPPTEERVRILRSMGGGASYFAYEAAANKAGRKSSVHIPATALAAEKAANLSAQSARAGAAPGGQALAAQAAGSPKAPSKARQPEPTARQRSLEAGDMVRRMHNFRFVECSCGLKMKIPRDYTKPQVKCPRCSKIHSLA